MIRKLEIDQAYLRFVMTRLIETPSPTGLTQAVTDLVRGELDGMRIPYELTRRGAIRANLEGARHSPDRAIVTHLDTLGAMVKELKTNGRLAIVPVGHWSSRFAEGARVTVFREDRHAMRGTILPLKASGHVYNEEIDTQPVSWNNVEIRLDDKIHNQQDLIDAGIHVGDHVAIDPNLEFSPSGFVNSRHLDDKAGVAAVLAMARAVRENEVSLPIDCHLLFTISEEVGVGASHVLHGDVAELVSIDNGTIAPGQNTNEYGATVVMQDMSGPFDWDLSRRLLRLCVEFGIRHSRDVFRYYRSDGAAALEAGNDIRTGLVCFALDSSHGYERSHIESITSVAELVGLYIQSSPIVLPNLHEIASGQSFPG